MPLVPLCPTFPPIFKWMNFILIVLNKSIKQPELKCYGVCYEMSQSYAHWRSITSYTFTFPSVHTSGSQPFLWRGPKSRLTTLLEGRTKEILTQVNWHVLIYSRTKSITQNIRYFVERLLRAAQTVLGGSMWLSKQWLRTTGPYCCSYIFCDTSALSLNTALWT